MVGAGCQLRPLLECLRVASTCGLSSFKHGGQAPSQAERKEGGEGEGEGESGRRERGALQGLGLSPVCGHVQRVRAVLVPAHIGKCEARAPIGGRASGK